MSAGDGKPSPDFFAARMDIVSHSAMCDNLHMATNLAIDDKLIEEARRLGEHRTKKEAVTTALEEYIQHCKQNQILEDFGTVDFDPEYDYKAERRRKRT
jgi:Arc/MetJ family transcription regulator